MTLQSNPPLGTRNPTTGKNNGYFEKPSKGIAAGGWGNREVYTVPEGKYARVTVSWDNQLYGFTVYDKAHGQHFAQIGNWGNEDSDESVTRHVENMVLYAGMTIRAGSSTTVGVVGCEYDL